MSSLRRTARFLVLMLSTVIARDAASAAGNLQGTQGATGPEHSGKSVSKRAPAEKQPSPDEELQQTINDAGNDRAGLVRNLEAFLQKYPESQQRPQIYRALVEACIQLRDTGRAAGYAERMVALSPSDMPITLLAIQLLERSGDEAGLRRAISYATRVLDFVNNESRAHKPPKISEVEWEAEKTRDRTTVLLLRGRLLLKVKNIADAQRDFETSYALLPSADAAEKLGEVAELQNDPKRAIAEYAKAFALADNENVGVRRREIRKKLGNEWRRVHGSDEGLGEYLLRSYDEVVSAAAGGAKPTTNANARDPYDFILRNASDGKPFPLAEMKGKVLVLNFWATWCGPCRALEPQFDRVASGFQDSQHILFVAANCDEDETLVPAYLAEVKPRATVLFADGLERLFGVNSFPTVLVIDPAGRIVYRSEGYGDDDFEHKLTAAVRHALAVDSAAPGKSAL
jgi:thiol-disulfide isomerase/thioredoxin